MNCAQRDLVNCNQHYWPGFIKRTLSWLEQLVKPCKYNLRKTKYEFISKTVMSIFICRVCWGWSRWSPTLFWAGKENEKNNTCHRTHPERVKNDSYCGDCSLNASACLYKYVFVIGVVLPPDDFPWIQKRIARLAKKNVASRIPERRSAFINC